MNKITTIQQAELEIARIMGLQTEWPNHEWGYQPIFYDCRRCGEYMGDDETRKSPCIYAPVFLRNWNAFGLMFEWLVKNEYGPRMSSHTASVWRVNKRSKPIRHEDTRVALGIAVLRAHRYEVEIECE